MYDKTHYNKKNNKNKTKNSCLENLKKKKENTWENERGRNRKKFFIKEEKKEWGKGKVKEWKFFPTRIGEHNHLERQEKWKQLCRHLWDKYKIEGKLFW